jgi:hypothetical protein
MAWGTMSDAQLEALHDLGLVAPVMVAGTSLLAIAAAPTAISILACLGSSAKFTVTNAGDGVMRWSASASRPAYKLSPASGSLDGGQQQIVTVSGISASGTVTIAAPGAANSPQTVKITCTL